jgi:hypothetical protein
VKHLLIPLVSFIALANPVNAKYWSDIDLMTDEIKHAIYFDSSTTAANSIGVEEEATIYIRCNVKNEKIVSFKSYIKTPTYNGSSTSVAVRWDKGEPLRTRWSGSASDTAFFAPKPKDFVNQLYNSDSLVFQWTPYNRVATAVKFDLGALKQDIDQMIQEGCNFK